LRERPAIILYADRNQLLQQTVRDVLEFAGWYVKTCSDSCMALALAESAQHFDLLLFDVEMSGFSGLEITRRIRLREHRRETPIVLISLYDRAEEAQRAGANAFLRKPNNLIELVDTIRRLLSSPESDPVTASMTE
jgi:CheY-like chemotaxis protein